MISDLAIRLFNVVVSECVRVHMRVRGESIPVCVCVCVCVLFSLALDAILLSRFSDAACVNLPCFFWWDSMVS